MSKRKKGCEQGRRLLFGSIKAKIEHKLQRWRENSIQQKANPLFYAG